MARLNPNTCKYCHGIRDWRCIWHQCAPAHVFQPKPQSTDENPSRRAKIRARKLRILESQGGVCWLCGKPCGDDMTYEHLRPRSKGGTGELSNLVITHSACNNRLGDLSVKKKVQIRRQVQGAEHGANIWGGLNGQGKI